MYKNTFCKLVIFLLLVIFQSLNYFIFFFFPSFNIENRRTDAIKIISINRKTETQFQQIAALRFPSSILAVTGKSDFQFSNF